MLCWLLWADTDGREAPGTPALKLWFQMQKMGLENTSCGLEVAREKTEPYLWQPSDFVNNKILYIF
jgi:hypothetical protein